MICTCLSSSSYLTESIQRVGAFCLLQFVITCKVIIQTYQYLYGVAEYSRNRCSPLLPDNLICSIYMTLQKARQASQLRHIDLLLP